MTKPKPPVENPTDAEIAFWENVYVCLTYDDDSDGSDGASHADAALKRRRERFGSHEFGRCGEHEDCRKNPEVGRACLRNK